MATVGYGNIVATTPYGRISVIFAILVGSFLLALLVGLIINWFSLPSNQEDAINNIELEWFAVKSVRASLEYNVARQKRNRFLRNQQHEDEIGRNPPSLEQLNILKT